MKFKGLDCILLVDDDIPTNYFHQIVIEESTIEAHVEPLSSGYDALAFLTRTGIYSENNQPLPGIIFLDINMPGMDGFEFLEEYKALKVAKKENTIVVVLTTSINPIDRQRVMHDKNIVTFISKPLTIEKLTEIAALYYT